MTNISPLQRAWISTTCITLLMGSYIVQTTKRIYAGTAALILAMRTQRNDDKKAGD